MNDLKSILTECETLYNDAQLNAKCEQVKHIKFYLTDDGLLSGEVSMFKREGAQSLTPLILRK